MIDFIKLHFLYPQVLFLVFLVFFLLFFYYKIEKKNSIGINFFDDLKKIQKFDFLFYLKGFLLAIIFVIFVIILADPQKINVEENVKKNGIDIVFAIDISGSMNETDISPSRLEKAKLLLKDFIKAQKTNRVGLVVFAGKPISSIALTFDYDILENTIDNISTKYLDSYPGTAIGDALLVSEKFFQNKNREKVIVLLTDGNSKNGVNPVLVAQNILKEKKIKVYTIGIGSTERTSKFPLNEKALEKIANITNGKFFRATDNNSFEKVFKNLESLEKNNIIIKQTKISSGNYKIFYFLFLFSIFLFFLIEGKRH